MNKQLLHGFLLIVFIAIIAGACKKEDDGDPSNPDEKDGQITFYTNSDECGAISLELNGEDIGSLSVVYIGDSEPECGAENTITVGVDVGAHEYYAEDNCNHIWSGTIIINKGDCKVKLLNRL